MIERLQSFRNIFRIPELKRRVLITLGLLAAYRLGAHVPTPGVDGARSRRVLQPGAGHAPRHGGPVLGRQPAAPDGVRARDHAVHLGVHHPAAPRPWSSPRWSAWPRRARRAKKITQYTRYGTIALSLMQSFGIAVGLESMRSAGGGDPRARPGVGLPADDDADAHHRHRADHVARRADLREGHRQRHLAHHLRGHVVRLPSAVVSSYQLIATGELRLLVFLGADRDDVAVTAAVV